MCSLPEQDVLLSQNLLKLITRIVCCEESRQCTRDMRVLFGFAACDILWCSNKDTVPIDFIDACNVEERLTLFANLSAMAIMLSFIICLLFGEYEPLGECDWSQ